MTMSDNGAIVTLSGGQDSSTCLAWALTEFRGPIRTVAFDYGQRHKVELDCAERISMNFGAISHVTLDAGALKQIGGAALTDDRIEPEVNTSKHSGNEYARAHGLPSTFVPGRNMLFLTLATAYGARFGVYDIVTGVCQADDAGYPDCRSGFVVQAGIALSEGLEEEITIHTPLMFRTKAQTWALAADLGCFEDIVEMTHTCYRGNHSIRHAWGYGCGTCGACNERRKGFAEYQVNRMGKA